MANVFELVPYGRPNTEIFHNVARLWPREFILDDYSAGLKGFGGVPFVTFFRNSLVLTSISTLGVVMSSLVVAYGFARTQFRFKGFLFAWMMVGLILPMQALMIPRFVVFQKLG